MTTKIRIILAVITLVILGVFNAVYWSLPYLLNYADHLGNGYYVSYGFITFSFIVSASAVFYSTKKDRDGFLYPAPLVYLSLSYAYLELSLGSPLGLVSRVSFLAAFIPQIIVSGIYIVLILLALMGIIFQRSVRDRALRKIGYINDVKEIIDKASFNSTDKDIKKKLDKLSENIRFSDPMSDDSLEEIEKNIFDLSNELSNKVALEENEEIDALIKKIDSLLYERNIKCKNLK